MVFARYVVVFALLAGVPAAGGLLQNSWQASREGPDIRLLIPGDYSFFHLMTFERSGFQAFGRSSDEREGDDKGDKGDKGDEGKDGKDKDKDDSDRRDRETDRDEDDSGDDGDRFGASLEDLMKVLREPDQDTFFLSSNWVDGNDLRQLLTLGTTFGAGSGRPELDGPDFGNPGSGHSDSGSSDSGSSVSGGGTPTLTLQSNALVLTSPDVLVDSGSPDLAAPEPRTAGLLAGGLGCFALASFVMKRCLPAVHTGPSIPLKNR